MPPHSDRVALRARYDRRQADVVLGAARVFAARGYNQTSVPELATALGIAAGTLYHYFASKEDLLIAICDQLMEPLLEKVGAILELSQRPEEQVRAVVRVWVTHVIEHRDHMLVFHQARHLIDHGEQWRDVRASRKRFEQVLAAVLDRAHERDLIRLDDVPLTLLALLGMVNHTAHWHRARGASTPLQIADAYVDLVLR